MNKHANRYQITEIIGLSFTWSDYRPAVCHEAENNGWLMREFFTEKLKLSPTRTKWLHNASKKVFEEEFKQACIYSCLAETMLILHFSGKGRNNCAAEAWFGDEVVSIQEAVLSASTHYPNLYVMLI